MDTTPDGPSLTGLWKGMGAVWRERGEDAETITPEQSELAMRRAVVAQCFGVPLAFTLSTGGLATLYAARFGGRDFMVGLINASLFAGALLGLLVPLLVERFNKRGVLVASALESILACAPLPMLPWVASAFSPDAALWVMAAAMSLFSLGNIAFAVAWYPALRDFVPPERTGRFFGTLRSTWQWVALAIYVASALLLGAEAPLSRFQWVLLALIIVSFVRVREVRLFPQKPLVAPEGGEFHDRVLRIGRDRGMVGMMLFTAAAWLLTVCLMPSMILFMRLCEFSAREIMIAVAAGMLASALALRPMGVWTDRRGPAWAYRVSLVMIAGALFLWAPVSYAVLGAGWRWAGYALMMVSIALHGIATAGMGIGTTRHIFLLAPERQAGLYLSTYPILTQVISGVGIFLVGVAFHLARVGGTPVDESLRRRLCHPRRMRPGASAGGEAPQARRYGG